jgi:hypothetical protein
MTVNLSMFAGAGAQFFDNNGAILSGGLVYTYAAGTTTPLAAYTTSAGNVAHTNPIVLDSAGRVASGGEIWLTDAVAYKFVLQTSVAVTIATYDNVTGNSSGISSGIYATFAASSGSSLIGYLSSGAGAIATTVQAKLRQYVSVKDFGAVGDGIVDDTTAMQNAHNTGKLVLYPAGTYKFSKFSFSQGGMIGDGRGISRLVSTSTNSDNLITYTGTGGSTAVPMFKDFHVEATNTKTGGAAIYVYPSSGELDYLLIDGISTYNVPIGISLNQCNYGQLVNSVILNYTDTGIYYQNRFNYAAGDFLISNNHIGTGQATGNRYGIFQDSGGGLRITGNKILGGVVGFALSYSGSIASGPLVIVGNSIENQTATSISLSCASTGAYGGILITGNELGVTKQGLLTDNSQKLTDLTFTGNYVYVNTTVAGSLGIYANVDNFVVSGNYITGGEYGIFISSQSSNGKLVGNTLSNSTNPIVNSSATTFVSGEIQSGVTGSISHTTVYGALYHGSVSITFPTPFKTIPVVTCNASGYPGFAGGFCGYATSITAAGFIYNLVSVATGSTDSNSWSAQGVC